MDRPPGSSMVELLGTSSKRTDANTLRLPGLPLPVPRSRGGPQWTHTATRDPQTLTGGSSQSLVGSLLLSTGSWGAQAFVCALQESLFSPVLWNFCNQTLLTFKVRFPGDFQSLCWIPQLGECRSQSYQKRFLHCCKDSRPH